jgi:Secretion system C-terminal sorting domain
MRHKIYLLLALVLLAVAPALAQHSVARLWNEQVLNAISNDLARPTVHARNLFHTSIAMYDAWAVYNDTADTYLLGKTVHGFFCPYRQIPLPQDIQAAQNEAISFAVYRLIRHRFAKSPGQENIYRETDALMDALGYKKGIVSTNYKAGPAQMGNYIAQCLIDYGLQDGSNETRDFANTYYKPVNPPMAIQFPGNQNVQDLNRWQPLQFTVFIDQSGNPSPNAIPAFLSPEWGNVHPFALQPADATLYQREGNSYTVYHDPGPPALLDTNNTAGLSDYHWNFALVTAWAALLDPADGVMIDASPGAIGNNTSYPSSFLEQRQFYNFESGGDAGAGWSMNPKTGQPYVPQWVRRGDYTRVLAEFWADGPKSVTPPGHWFEILNYVNDQPAHVRKWRGTGPELSPLEWDVKAYFALGGAMHDAAITAWGIKGWYDSSRPVTAIRGMAEKGQCSDPSLPHFNPAGLPLIPGFIEIIDENDVLAGPGGLYAGEVKLKSWRGPAFIQDPLSSVAGVGWIRAKEWWPYQRPTFVTPPFAGYISGHSTYSRAAAELMTYMTGDAFFPGGMGTFLCPKNEYLVFEDGPSSDITLQWATYRDASDQCSLSRIYGGIHPPMDDIPGRLIGIKIGPAALQYAEQFFRKTTKPEARYDFRIFPNPTRNVVQLELDHAGDLPIQVYAIDGRLVLTTDVTFTDGRSVLDLSALSAGMYVVAALDADGKRIWQEKVVVE